MWDRRHGGSEFAAWHLRVLGFRVSMFAKQQTGSEQARRNSRNLAAILEESNGGT